MPQGKTNLHSIGNMNNQSVMERIGYENSNDELDYIFSALADPTRRAILMRLSDGEASVKDLAEPFEMSQPAISKHLKTLERAGLIERAIDAQRRPARLKAVPMKSAVDFLDYFRAHWNTRLDKLDTLLTEMKKEEGTPHE